MCFLRTLIAMVYLCPSIDPFRSLGSVPSTPICVPDDLLLSFCRFCFAIISRIAISTVHTRLCAQSKRGYVNVVLQRYFITSDISWIYLDFIREKILAHKSTCAFYPEGNLSNRYRDNFFVCTVPLSLTRERNYRGGPLLKNIDRILWIFIAANRTYRIRWRQAF